MYDQFCSSWQAYLSCLVGRQLTCHKIQKQIVEACAEVTTKVVMNELGDGNFSLLVDESRDVSVREQMAVIVRLVIGPDCSNSE